MGSLSILDVGTLNNSFELAPWAEKQGFDRYWVSEHHGEGAIPTPIIACTLLGGMTSTMRVGVAGVLLRFQSTLAVAQAFRTLQWVFSGRVDLGVARPGVHRDALDANLRDGRSGEYTPEEHARKVEELQTLLSDRVPLGHPMHGQPVEPSLHAELGPPPLWLLSSSVGGAKLAAKLGARFSYHDYYGRDGGDAVRAYLAEFKPSPELKAPEWNVAFDAFVSETEAMARQRRIRPDHPDGEKNQFFAGSQTQFEAHVRRIAETYQTTNFVLSTLRGPYELDLQIDSLRRAYEVIKHVAG